MVVIYNLEHSIMLTSLLCVDHKMNYCGFPIDIVVSCSPQFLGKTDDVIAKFR